MSGNDKIDIQTPGKKLIEKIEEAQNKYKEFHDHTLTKIDNLNTRLAELTEKLNKIQNGSEEH